jgi:hypothetical protein
LECNPRSDNAIVSGCTDYDIARRCVNSALSTMQCVQQEKQYCQAFKVRRYQSTSAATENLQNPCIEVDKICTVGNTYWHIASGKCQSCDSNDLNHQTGFLSGHQCLAAYPGKRSCVDQGYETGYFQTQDTTTVQTSNGIQCTKCSTCLIGQYQTTPCASEYIYANNKPPYMRLLSQQTGCADCTGICLLGEYRDCIKGASSSLDGIPTTCTPCNCEATPDRNACNRETQYCSLDTTQCNGRTNVTTGGSCEDRNKVTCPINWYMQQLTAPAPLRTLLSHDSTDVLCSPCIHPNASTGGICPKNYEWPFCKQKGQHYPLGPCQQCSIEDQRQIMDEIDVPGAHECKWHCPKDYFKEDGKCKPCDDSYCPEGQARAVCPEGMLGPNGCVDCDNSLCEQGKTYLTKCSGRGHFGLGGTPAYQTANECVACEETGVCDGGTFWQPCAGDTREPQVADPGECVACATDSNQAPAHSSWVSCTDTFRCDNDCAFYCHTGYYFAPRQDAFTQPGCNVCEDRPTACNCVGAACDAYFVEECDTSHRTSPPACTCAAGYQPDLHHTDSLRCIACDDYLYSRVSSDGCHSCPFGHTGHAEFASSGCIPCELNTYRPSKIAKSSTSTSTCIHCPAGTDGLAGSQVCQECGSTGMKAILRPWSWYVFNYKSSTTCYRQSDLMRQGGCWMKWDGIIPTTCDVAGTNTTVQICSADSDVESIRWGVDPPNAEGWVVANSTVEYLIPKFTCGWCDGGLAYSGTFNYADAFENNFYS